VEINFAGTLRFLPAPVLMASPVATLRSSAEKTRALALPAEF
jgi:hypothetical protein